MFLSTWGALQYGKTIFLRCIYLFCRQISQTEQGCGERNSISKFSRGHAFKFLSREFQWSCRWKRGHVLHLPGKVPSSQHEAGGLPAKVQLSIAICLQNHQTLGKDITGAFLKKLLPVFLALNQHTSA